MPDARLALVYAEAQRSITQQQDVLNQLRSNAGTLLGAVSLATGFLAGLHGDSPLGAWGNAAVCAFITAVFFAVLILWPRNKWKFRFRSDVLLNGYVDAGADMNLMHRELATYLERGLNGSFEEPRSVRLCVTNWGHYVLEKTQPSSTI